MSLTPFVYVDTPLAGACRGEHLRVTDATAKHLKTVLRLSVGAAVMVSDGAGMCATATLLDANTVTLTTDATSSELPDVTVVLAQGVPKLRKLDTVVRLATEASVTSVVPVVTARSPVKIDEVATARHVERLTAIIDAAGEQARRTRRLTLHEPSRFAAFCDTARDTAWLVCDGDGEPIDTAVSRVLPKARALHTLTIMVGPEGGFTADELAFATSCGAVVTRLADSVLRTEHAGLFAVGAVTALLGRDR